jgi:hypothetical protein
VGCRREISSPAPVERIHWDDDASLRCGTWFVVENGWPEAGRDNEGAERYWLGVRVVFDHDWLTGFAWFSGSVCTAAQPVGTAGMPIPS